MKGNTKLRAVSPKLLVLGLTLLMSACGETPTTPLELDSPNEKFYSRIGPIVRVNLPASADNTLYESAAGTLSNGGGTQMISGRTNQPSNSIRRAVVAFDIAGALPANSTVLSATLTMTLEGTSNFTVDTLTLQPVLASWGEGTTVAANQGQGGTAVAGDMTWLHRFFNTTAWGSVGGDFNAVASASTVVSVLGTYSWTSTAMRNDVQGWLNTPASNHGWLILGNESVGATAKKFFTRESGVTPPILNVKYR